MSVTRSKFTLGHCEPPVVAGLSFNPPTPPYILSSNQIIYKPVNHFYYQLVLSNIFIVVLKTITVACVLPPAGKRA